VYIIAGNSHFTGFLESSASEVKALEQRITLAAIEFKNALLWYSPTHIAHRRHTEFDFEVELKL